MIDKETNQQVHMLRMQCIWQRAQGTKRDNGYPYHKHVPDCEICRSADLIETLQTECINAKNEMVKQASTITQIANENAALQAQVEGYKTQVTAQIAVAKELQAENLKLQRESLVTVLDASEEYGAVVAKCEDYDVAVGNAIENADRLPFVVGIQFKDFNELKRIKGGE